MYAIYIMEKGNKLKFSVLVFFLFPSYFCKKWSEKEIEELCHETERDLNLEALRA
jgi:hypothetical protein